jgi:hypothetical protein
MMSAFLMLATMSLSGGEELKLAVSPAVSMAPTNLNIRARVVPSAQNRALQVVAESGEFYRSSEIQLEGEHAPATITFEFRSVPSGDYMVHGTLIDSAGRRRAIAQQHVTVVSAMGQ